MGSAWVSPYISHSTGNCNKTHGKGKFWEIDNHTLPIVWVLFSDPILILWYTSAYGKCMGYPINFLQYGKMQQNPLYGVKLRNWYSYFSHSMGHFSPCISHSTGKCNKTDRMGSTWEIGAHTLPILWTLFSHQIPILWFTLSHGKCMCFLINFP